MKDEQGGMEPNQQDVDSPFHCPREVSDLLRELEASQLEKDLRECHKVAHIARQALAESTDFEFKGKDFIEAMREKGRSVDHRGFWWQVGLLLIFVTSSASRPILQLIDGIVWAVLMRNEVVFALTLRALMEQVSVLARVAARAEELLQPRLEKDVWPCHGGSEAPIPTDKDEELRDYLLRYAIGRRISFEHGEEPPLATASAKAWAGFLRSAQVDIKDEAFAGQVLSDLDWVAKREGSRHWRVIYEVLCEFCHPNSESRTTDCLGPVGAAGRWTVERVASSALPYSMFQLVRLASEALPIAREHLTTAFDRLAHALPPMENDDLDEATSSPQIGSVPVVDTSGKRMWIDPRRVIINSEPPDVPLSSSQLDRLQAIVELFQEHDPRPLEVRAAEIANDLDPAGELLLFEAIAEVYQQEVAERTECRRDERHLMYMALVQATFCSSPEELLNVLPKAKGLRRLDRLFRRLKKLQQG